MRTGSSTSARHRSSGSAGACPLREDVASSRLRPRLERAVGRLARQSPAARLARLEERLDGIGSRLVRAPQQPASHRSERVAVLARSLEAVSPYAVLRRGYSITRPLAGGPPLRSGAEVAKGTVVETLLADGRLVSEVTEAEEGQEARRADTDAAGDGA